MIPKLQITTMIPKILKTRIIASYSKYKNPKSEVTVKFSKDVED